MYDPENDSIDRSNDHSSKSDTVHSAASAKSKAAPAKPKAPAIILECAYCRKKFDRASTKAMPFCSHRCKQIDLGLWLNEVHSMPYEIDPGAYPDPE